MLYCVLLLISKYLKTQTFFLFQIIIKIIAIVNISLIILINQNAFSYKVFEEQRFFGYQFY